MNILGDGSPYCRRRINTEEKAKVVAAVWVTELIQFLAALDILHQDDLKKRINSSYSSNSPCANQIKSSLCNSSYSSNRLYAIHPIFQILLVQFILFFSYLPKESSSLPCSGRNTVYIQHILSNACSDE